MSKALELADKLNGLCVAEFAWPHLNDAANTLRRQHAEIAALKADRDSWMQQASDRVADAVTFAKEADGLRAEIDALRKEAEWQPIETAPRGAKGYAWMHLAWGPEHDQSTSVGMRYGDKFYASASFYCLGRDKQYEFRETEVSPTHWKPLPTPPAMGEEA
jgi:hypothetical protein